MNYGYELVYLTPVRYAFQSTQSTLAGLIDLRSNPFLLSASRLHPFHASYTQLFALASSIDIQIFRATAASFAYMPSFTSSDSQVSKIALRVRASGVLAQSPSSPTASSSFCQYSSTQSHAGSAKVTTFVAKWALSLKVGARRQYVSQIRFVREKQRLTSRVSRGW